MNDHKIANQDASSADEAQKILADGEHYSGGSTMLDAKIEASNRSMDNPPSGNPIATNLNNDTDFDDPNNTALFTKSSSVSDRDKPNPEMTAKNTNLNLEHSQDS